MNSRQSHMKIDRRGWSMEIGELFSPSVRWLSQSLGWESTGWPSALREEIRKRRRGRIFFMVG